MIRTARQAARRERERTRQMTGTRRKPYRESGPPGEEVLDTSPFPDDLDAQLAAAAPRRGGMSKLTLGLAAGVVFVAGVIVGIQAHRAVGGGQTGGTRPVGAAGGGGYGQVRSGGESAGQSAPERAAQGDGQGDGQGAARGRGGFGPRGGGGFGGATVGTVSRVDGDKIEIRTPQGETITVRTGDDTRIRITRDGEPADLKQGATVVVRGDRAADGTVAATEVSETSDRRAGFGGVMRGGG